MSRSACVIHQCGCPPSAAISTDNLVMYSAIASRRSRHHLQVIEFAVIIWSPSLPSVHFIAFLSCCVVLASFPSCHLIGLDLVEWITMSWAHSVISFPQVVWTKQLSSPATSFAIDVPQSMLILLLLCQPAQGLSDFFMIAHVHIVWIYSVVQVIVPS